jgi:hypothetical protein
VFRIEPTAMISSHRIQQLVIDRYEGDATLRAEFDPRNFASVGWHDMALPSGAEMQPLMSAARATHPVLDIPERHYSNRLVPHPPEMRPPAAPPGTIRLAGSTDVSFEVPPGRSSIELVVSVSEGAKVPGDMVNVFAPDGHVLRQELVVPDGAPHHISVPTPAAGRYRLHVEDQKAMFLLTPPAGVPMALGALICPSPSPMVYFFVPKGLRRLGLYAPGAVPIKLYDGDGRLVPQGPFSSTVVVDVPNGEDGRVWSLKDYKAWQTLRMVNAPQSFALSPDAVMVPDDAIH